MATSETRGTARQASETPENGTRRNQGLKELTIRGIVIGAIITLIFTAANVYLGLKVGLTFATSIPAAVISMAVLRFFRNHSIPENNIVQTIASSAGTLSAIIFVLPGLVMIGWWTGFPYWITVAVCAIGGILGVMYSIPLRRALVTGSDLPYPEGVAGAEVLRVGDSQGGAEENKRGLYAIIAGVIASVAFSILSSLKLAAGSVSTAFRVGAGGTMIGTSLSFALLGVGHLVGITVGIAMIVGMLVSYGVLLPIRSAGHLSHGPLADALAAVTSSDIRFIGAGAIAVAAMWTLVRIIVPIVRGIQESIASARRRKSGERVERVERDLPISMVVLITLLSMIPVALLLWGFVQGTPLASNAWGLVLIGVLYILVMGLIIASVCGYMAGLIGSSNSPISGVGILVALTAAALIVTVHGHNSSQIPALVAFTIFTASVVFGIATISNDNLQDLKTGQLVGSTPWKQQVALVIGVVFGSLIIPPVLSLMSSSFGFAGAPGAGPNALAAPQASLISSLVKGVVGGDLQWNLIGMGALIGCAAILVDEILRAVTRKRMSLPPLAVGMGMYLPMTTTILIPIGALLGMLYNRYADRTQRPEFSRRLGVLLATGLIVGESLFGVVFAGIVAATGKEAPLAIVGDAFATPAIWIGLVVFAAGALGLYAWTHCTAKKPLPENDTAAAPTA